MSFCSIFLGVSKSGFVEDGLRILDPRDFHGVYDFSLS